MSSTGSCAPFTAFSCTGGTSYYALGQTAPTGASCGVATSSTTLPEPTWGISVTGCGLRVPPSPTGCAGGRVCAPPPPSPGPLCVMMTGDVACPSASSYATKHVYYEGFGEGRSCSTCTCATTTTGSCSGQFNLFTGTGCSGSTQVLQVTFGMCASIPAGTHSLDLNYLTLTEPSCAASGGIAQGKATALNPTTMCCTF
jgi:hypothetical protein